MAIGCSDTLDQSNSLCVAESSEEKSSTIRSSDAPLSKVLMPNGLSTRVSLRERVKCAEAKYSTPVDPKAISAMHRFNQRWPHHLLEGSMATSRHSLTKSFDALPSEVPMPYAEKVHNGHKWLLRICGLYKCLTPVIFKMLEFRETPYTLKNTSKPTQVLSDQILSS